MIRMTIRKHKPSGILIVWLGKDSKIHTQSIPNRQTSLGWRQVEMGARTELLCKQLDCLQYDFETGSNHPVMITTGLTRVEAKDALRSELLSLLQIQIGEGR